MGNNGHSTNTKKPTHELLLHEIREIVYESPDTRAVGPSVQETKTRFRTPCQVLASMEIPSREKPRTLKKLEYLYKRACWETEVAEAIDAELQRTIKAIQRG